MDQKKAADRVYARAVQTLRAQHRNKMPVAVAEKSVSKSLRRRLHGSVDAPYIAPLFPDDGPSKGDVLAFEAANKKRERRASRNVRVAGTSLYTPVVVEQPKPKRTRTKKVVES